MNALAESLASYLAPVVEPAHGDRACAHLSVFGSAAHKPLEHVHDVDVHVVVQEMTGKLLEELVRAGEALARVLSYRRQLPATLELRQGPFKPEPGGEQRLQLHLMLDDEQSLARTPWALIAHRVATGTLIAGRPLSEFDRLAQPGDSIAEARFELDRWRCALLAQHIPFRSWVVAGSPRLVEARVMATTPWERWCILLGAARSVDLHCLLLAFLRPELGDGFRRSLLSAVDPSVSWEDFGERAGHVSDRAASVIGERLARLEDMVSSLPDRSAPGQSRRAGSGTE